MNNYYDKELNFKVGEDITASMCKAIDMGNMKDPDLWKPKKAVIKEVTSTEEKLVVSVEVEIPYTEAKTIGGSCKIDAVLAWLVSRLPENEVYFRKLKEVDDTHTLFTAVFSNAVSLNDIADVNTELGLVTTYEVRWPSFTGYEADFIVYGKSGMVFHSGMRRDTRDWCDWRLVDITTNNLSSEENRYIVDNYQRFDYRNKRIMRRERSPHEM